MLSVNRQIWDVYTDGLVPIACSEPITTPHEVKEHGKKGEAVTKKRREARVCFHSHPETFQSLLEGPRG